jgi:GTP cyclohydrolase I
MSDPKDIDFDRIENAVRELLGAIGEDPERDGLLDTPARVARMYGEICSGLREEPAAHLEKTFQVEHDEIIVVRDISFYSICEHHLIPFFGKASCRLPSRKGWADYRAIEVGKIGRWLCASSASSGAPHWSNC